MISFLQFYENVKDQAVPEGLAENLQATFRSAIVNGLIEIQTNVPCYRDFHIDFYTKRDCQEYCDLSIINGPRGVVNQVYAFKPGEDCKKYFYLRRGSTFIQCWTEKQKCTNCNPSTPATTFVYEAPYCNYVIPGQDACDIYGLSTEDDTWFKCGCLAGCTHEKYFAVGPEYQLFLAPRFPCGYVVACQWTGIKRTWDDQDTVPDDNDLLNAVSKYVEAEMSAKDREWVDVNGLRTDFLLIQQQMAQRCREERRITKTDDCATAIVDPLLPFINPLPYAETAASMASTGGQSDRDDHILVGRTLRVDQVYGSDQTGRRAEWNLPFKTITAAKLAAISGDEIVVGPGTYAERDLQKAGVNYHFEPGAIVRWVEPGYIATSSTNLLLGTGNKTFTVPAGLPFVAGGLIFVGPPPNSFNTDEGGNEYILYGGRGTVASYSGTTLVVNFTSVQNPVTFNSWLIWYNGYGIFDDRAPGAVGNYKITGDGEFYFENSNPANPNCKGAVVSTSLSNGFQIDLDKVTATGPTILSNGDFACFSIRFCANDSVINCQLNLSTNTQWSNLNALDPTTAPSSGMGLFWGQGDLYFNFDKILTYFDYGIWAEETSTGATSNLYLRGHLIDSVNFSPFYCNTLTNGYRVWCDCLELLGGSIGINLIGQGKIYVNCQKVQAPIAIANSCEAWIIAEKVSATETWVQQAGYANAMGTGSNNCHITCQHFEDLANIGNSGTPIVNNSAATLFLHGGYIKVGSQGKWGIVHNSGLTKAYNMTIDTSANNTATNYPVNVNANGLELYGCKLFAPAATPNSIFSSAAYTVQFVGTSLANKAANGSTTQKPLASLIVDATIIA